MDTLNQTTKINHAIELNTYGDELCIAALILSDTRDYFECSEPLNDRLGYLADGLGKMGHALQHAAAQIEKRSPLVGLGSESAEERMQRKIAWCRKYMTRLK